VRAELVEAAFDAVAEVQGVLGGDEGVEVEAPAAPHDAVQHRADGGHGVAAGADPDPAALAGALEPLGGELRVDLGLDAQDGGGDQPAGVGHVAPDQLRRDAGVDDALDAFVAASGLAQQQLRGRDEQHAVFEQPAGAEQQVAEPDRVVELAGGPDLSDQRGPGELHLDEAAAFAFPQPGHFGAVRHPDGVLAGLLGFVGLDLFQRGALRGSGLSEALHALKSIRHSIEHTCVMRQQTLALLEKDALPTEDQKW
jgi:hypothetical protein